MTPPPRPKTPRGVEPRLRQGPDGPVWRYRVRWLDPSSGRRLAEEVDTIQDALDFQAHLRLLKRRGALGDLDRGRIRLDRFAQEWLERHGARNLERSTLVSYVGLCNRELLPRLGHLELRQVTPSVVATLREHMERDGRGAPTVRRTMAVLQSILREAVIWGHLDQNPAQSVRKPPTRRKLAIRPLAPAQVEEVRDVGPTLRDATLVSVMAYAGLRPEEALALTWGHLGETTLLVEQKNVDGEIHVGLKVASRPPRSVALLRALRHDLAEYRIALGAPDAAHLVFPRPDGAAWRATDYRNWRTRAYQRNIRPLGLSRRPYDLRHSYASLLLRDPWLTIADVAEQMGHSVQTLSEHYAHVIAELKGQPPMSADDQITAARTTRRAHYKR